EAFVADGLARKKLGSKFDRPRDMTFEGTNKPLVQPHAPFGLLSRNDLSQLAKELFKPDLDTVFNLRAIDVGRLVQIESEQIILHPSLHHRQIPFFPVKQDKPIDVPSEEELGCSVVGLGC